MGVACSGGRSRGLLAAHPSFHRRSGGEGERGRGRREGRERERRWRVRESRRG
jgi:hypothetical protein